MRSRILVSILTVIALVSGAAIAGAARTGGLDREFLRPHHGVTEGFVPAVAVSRSGRYFVLMRAPSVSQRVAAAPRTMGRAAQRATSRSALRSQRGAIRAVKDAGGTIVFRYSVLLNGFSAQMSQSDATRLLRRGDVASVQPVAVVQRTNDQSVPFIGAKKVWQELGIRGQGMRVAVVDTGIDYTHADFGGPGTVAAYESNDPNFIEPGTFPTDKVIGGFDFVGSNYDVLDEDTSNDIPRPDADPLDRDGHGTHTAGTCCGSGVPGIVGKGVAPAAGLYAIKVWDVGNSSADVLVAGYEFAVDPNQDGSTTDHADVLSFSGGVDYGTSNSAEALAAERVVGIGTVFVASAGNSGNQAAGGSAYILGTPAAAPGVIAVAASIDQYVLNTITVNSPTVTFPEGGYLAMQDWGAPLPSGGFTGDLFDARALDPPADPGGTVEPTDQQFCSALPAGSLDGVIPVVFKGATADGDCSGSTKVFNAQEAGAVGVILHSGFTGLPVVLGTNGEAVTIPAGMVSTADGQALLDALSPAPPAYNVVAVNATMNDFSTPVAGYADAMTDFTSEGPARGISSLKPDISAPGYDIQSAAVGTGNGVASSSGTSMAAPHISGVAALLLQMHPNWSPQKIKALMMNQATRNMANNDLSEPVSATVMGSGRVQAYQSALADSIAYPASVSFGLVPAEGQQTMTRPFWVENTDGRSHHYKVTADVRYTDFDPSIAVLSVSLNGTGFGGSRSFDLGPHDRQRVWLRLKVKPGVISEPEQEYGWYYFHPNVDGSVVIQQSRGGRADTLRVPWHIAPLAASESSLSDSELDLTGGPATVTLETAPAPGVDFADVYHLGTTDPQRSLGEEDIVAVGARTFTGPTINGTASGLPTGTDALAGIDWITFLTQVDEPTEPVEFVVQTAGVHNTTETLEIDVAIDVGADGVFADPELQADFLVVKTPDAGGNVCVFDLSLADPFADCAALYFADYSNYNANVAGLVVDAATIGLSTGTSNFSYQVTACTGRFAGDDPAQICDAAGAFDDATGTYDLLFDATAPPLAVSPSVCGGFFGGTDCAGGITVDVGSAGAGDDPTLLAIFPNNAPSRSPALVTTST